ncbi:50S ribosomal protein L13 [Patescibacteria group bacterium]|jgi:large subunit ribosomal protein L13|nr:50S ribosomal protein L13 [Patescibacteria group bacterium]
MTDTYTIDATGKKIGRIATEAARVLMGKHTPSYAPNKAGTTRVSIENASQLSITEGKLRQKEYDRYSGYPGGRSTLRMEEVIEKKGHKEIVRHAVKGMLPKNRLQAPRLKRLTVTD